MAFLATIAKYISQEVLTNLGKDVVAEGRKLFQSQLDKGVPRGEAARVTAEFMLKYTARKSRDDVIKVGKTAGSMAAKGAQAGARLLREKLGKK